MRREEAQPTELRLLALLAAFRDAGDARARATLNDWLRADPLARATMARLLVDEQALIDRLRQDDIVDLLQAGPARRATPRLSARPSRRAPRWGIAAAAAVLLIAGLFLWPPAAREVPTHAQAPSPEPVALIKEAVDAVWKDLRPAPGSALLPGTLVLESGMAAIEFASGARLLLEGPAELEIVSGMELFCRSGKMRVQVPPPARGFVVGTPKLRVVDTGTAFGLAVNGDGSSSVKVLEGAVELHQDRGVRDLKQGAAMVADAAGRLVPAALPDEAFPSEARFRERVHADDRLGVARWQSCADRIAADPATLLAFTFQESSDTSRSVRNHAAKATLESHGSLVGTRWTTGRWPGKRALEFRGRGDRLLFKLGGSSSSATCFAWLRVDSLPNLYHVLLMPDSSRDSALQWILQGSGQTRLALTNGIGDPATPAGWEGPVKAKAISQLELGRWVFFAATYDSRTGRVVHYRDGQPIGSGLFPGQLPVSFGSYAFGNWPAGSMKPGGRPHRDSFRNFSGCLDELAVISRALSPAEISRLHQEGKP